MMMANSSTQGPELKAAATSDAGTWAHCRRVGAWCDELARKLHLPADQSAALVEAALLHHHTGLLRGPSMARLMGDLGLPAQEVHDGQQRPSRLAERILLRFGSCRSGERDERLFELVNILESANCLDEQLEFAPFEQHGIDRILDAAGDEGQDSKGLLGFAIETLRCASREDLARIMPKLPVYPAVAMRLYRLLANEDVTLASLDGIARADQVVAGKLMNAANSVHYSPWQPIKSVAQAIGYVGTDDARRILIASSIQPLFGAPRARKLWRHALDAAQVAEKIAEMAGMVDPAEAFLLGLLHDVGKLAIGLMSKETIGIYERLLDRGCQPVTAEMVLCGFDHAEAGAEVLRFWKFSEETVAAVQYHHQPERTSSPLASVLYLTEFWTDSEEDIPSNARLYTAMRVTGISPEALESARINFNGALAQL